MRISNFITFDELVKKFSNNIYALATMIVKRD